MNTEIAAKKEGRLWRLFSPIRAAVFGRQNERLEYLADTFFKMSPEARAGIIVGGILGFFITILAIIWLYIIGLEKLQTRLDGAYGALNKLRQLDASHAVSTAKSKALADRFSSANQNLSLVTLVEEKAKTMGIKISFSSPQRDTAPGTPLRDSSLKNHRVAQMAFNIENVGLKRASEFIIELERLPNMLHVTSLKLSRGFTNKLYLDAEIEIETLIPPAK